MGKEGSFSYLALVNTKRTELTDSPTNSQRCYRGCLQTLLNTKLNEKNPFSMEIFLFLFYVPDSIKLHVANEGVNHSPAFSSYSESTSKPAYFSPTTLKEAQTD